MSEMIIGILVSSDRAAAGVYEDRGSSAVLEYLAAKVKSEYATLVEVVPDEQTVIEAKLKEWSDEKKCSLILTTGGTGPAERDCAPEATVAVVEKIMPGFGEAMRMTTFPKVPTSILSRATAGVRGETFIINLPGSPKAIAECLDPVLQAVPHVIRIRGGPPLALHSTSTTSERDPNLHHHSNVH
uniref:molybdopterin molybdotransferase n=1 Tax=Rhodosorus marinus TaxID=101924 RepID=A0A7S0BP74_9RHOD|mmetsp:Transcript_25195/g.36296  ORF Transcript_25195/g.36296 Transcript_25195/m.36296 type:complete len:185 (+) Transcript_25195:107-661(+)|eukprot:CAMPEP_0184742188 /NCGR_PEP_ID=MMETSP0315-20130426/5206_1 /TAXON_ID=101924 /ORGANISM="Rhodosorus marinus, Strain UTEX LB 2760" /LENGTH=184 /DNA_ID=CAMNT_0027212937 /DNA_START=24 /DNA_END=578 /DNA_ORIENTATION=-